ncbi:MAG TPA: glycosyltransferase family 1 protein [Solirubrobacteraceae bacterium]|jgi:glycosyltransferase involved in cell wall biosynthesis
MTLTLPPRIGINALFLEPNMGGLDTYVRALVPELTRLAPDVHFSVFCNPRGREYLAAEQWADGQVELVAHPLLGIRGLKAVTELTALGAIASREVDLLHSVALTAPLRTRAVSVVTLADVTWIVAPDPGEIWTTRLWRIVVPPAARRAERVLTLSEAAADHIVEHLHLRRDRIDVVPLAPGTSDRLTPTPARELRARLGLGEGPIVLSVSAKKIHKNLTRLVEAMALVVARYPDATLVLPGNPTQHEQELRALAAERGIAEKVAFPAYVDARDLEGLYSAANCFVFASINEGFGIPILEAMRRGVPVACSRASALPEVAGEAALYFDPYSVPAIADALLELLSNPELAGRLAALGSERQAAFTWEATALGTLETYERAWVQAQRHGGVTRRPGRMRRHPGRYP